MLAQAIRNNLKSIDSLRINSKSIPYRSFDVVKEVTEVESDVVCDVDIAEFDIEIVENPDEVSVEFPIISGIELEEKLPFFKSITYKLAQVF